MFASTDSIFTILGIGLRVFGERTRRKRTPSSDCFAVPAECWRPAVSDVGRFYSSLVLQERTRDSPPCVLYLFPDFVLLSHLPNSSSKYMCWTPWKKRPSLFSSTRSVQLTRSRTPTAAKWRCTLLFARSSARSLLSSLRQRGVYFSVLADRGHAYSRAVVVVTAKVGDLQTVMASGHERAFGIACVKTLFERLVSICELDSSICQVNKQDHADSRFPGGALVLACGGSFKFGGGVARE